MAYGRIMQVRTAALGIAHAINDATHCTFLVQDSTGGVTRLLPRGFVTTGNHGLIADVITDNTVAGGGVTTFDALVVAAHSRFDIGPVVTGATPQTRTAAQVSSWARTGAAPIYPGHPPMRSLHKEVVFVLEQPATFVDVTITHRLGTTNVVTFVSPTLDPVDPNAVGSLATIWQQATPSNDTVTLRMALDTNAAPAGVAVMTVNFDVMVVSRFGSGFHSSIGRLQGQGTIPLGTYVAGDDYNAGDRQLTAAQVNRSGGPASYGCLYTNVDALAVAGAAYAHNMGSATGAMALFGRRTNPLLNIPVILGNATTVDTMTIGNTVAGPSNDWDVMFVRPYSPYIL